ncbi:MAG: hypothetical protein NVSMB30_10610 [Hymenobacter sp.]
MVIVRFPALSLLVFPLTVRLLGVVAAVVVCVCTAQLAAAQRSASAPPRATRNAHERIALASRPGATPAVSSPQRLACAPLGGRVYDPNGRPLVGATLLVKGTHQVYVTDSEGKFYLTDPVYQGQVLAVDAAGFTTREVLLTDCTLPRLVLEQATDAHIKRSGKRAGQVTRLHNRNTNLR